MNQLHVEEMIVLEGPVFYFHSYWRTHVALALNDPTFRQPHGRFSENTWHFSLIETILSFSGGDFLKKSWMIDRVLYLKYFLGL